MTRGFWCNMALSCIDSSPILVQCQFYPFFISNECKLYTPKWYGQKIKSAGQREALHLLPKWHVGCAGPEPLNWLLLQCDGWKVAWVSFTQSRAALFKPTLNHHHLTRPNFNWLSSSETLPQPGLPHSDAPLVSTYMSELIFGVTGGHVRFFLAA